MPDDIYQRLRAQIEGQRQVPIQQDKESLRIRAEIEVEVERKLQYMLFFRTHIFPAVPDYMRTVLRLQRGKLEEARLQGIIRIYYPLEQNLETELGYRIPVRTESSEQTQLFQAVVSSQMPSKPSRYYLLVLRADAANSQMELIIDIYDNLGRKIGSLPGDFKAIDSFSEFKEGEFVQVVQGLVVPGVERCLQDQID